METIEVRRSKFRLFWDSLGILLAIVVLVYLRSARPELFRVALLAFGFSTLISLIPYFRGSLLLTVDEHGIHSPRWHFRTIPWDRIHSVHPYRRRRLFFWIDDPEALGLKRSPLRRLARPLDLPRDARGVHVNLAQSDVDFDRLLSTIQQKLHRLDPARHLAVNPDGL